jgi:hypothetical protein
VPQFSWPGHPNGFPDGAAAPPAHGSGVLKADSIPGVDPVIPGSRRFPAPIKALVLVASLLVAGLGSWAALREPRPTLVKQFWQPFVNSSEPTLFCLADQPQYASIRLRDAADPQHETTLPDNMVTVIIDDVDPLVNIAGTLRTYGKNYRVLGESTTTLTATGKLVSIRLLAKENLLEVLPS